MTPAELVAIAGARGVEVIRLPAAIGVTAAYFPEKQAIVISDDLAGDDYHRVLAHEVAHLVLGHAPATPDHGPLEAEADALAAEWLR